MAKKRDAAARDPQLKYKWNTRQGNHASSISTRRPTVRMGWMALPGGLSFLETIWCGAECWRSINPDGECGYGTAEQVQWLALVEVYLRDCAQEERLAAALRSKVDRELLVGRVEEKSQGRVRTRWDCNGKRLKRRRLGSCPRSSLLLLFFRSAGFFELGILSKCVS